MKKIAEYFEELSPDVMDKWPLHMSFLGLKTEYLEIKDFFQQAGTMRALDIKANIKSPNETYVCNTSWMLDDGHISVSIDELYRSSNMVYTKYFAAHLLTKMQSFLQAQDKTRDLSKNKYEEPSEIKINAHSKVSEHSRGGLLWASQGFDFASQNELEMARKGFHIFAENKGVKLATKDMQLFTKPCHFAAFDCGISFNDEAGRQLSLGKSFLLNHSWNGVWKNENPKAEEKRYAAAHLNDNKNPLSTLNPAYLRMLKRYQNKHSTLQKKPSLSISILSSLRSFAK